MDPLKQKWRGNWVQAESIPHVDKSRDSLPTERSAYITTGTYFSRPRLSLAVYFFCSETSISFCHLFCSAFDRKPFSFNKPLTPPSTPASPFGSTASAATHPLPKRVMPPAQTQSHGPPLLPGSSHSSTPPHQRAQTPLHSQSPPFAVPCPPGKHHEASYNTEHRYFFSLTLTLFLWSWAVRACWKCCYLLGSWPVLGVILLKVSHLPGKQCYVYTVQVSRVN